MSSTDNGENQIRYEEVECRYQNTEERTKLNVLREEDERGN